ncbi:MAG: putative Ig domain-containing protein [Acidobacteriales bacterium]|nr:putative Ig domain-containing protein [Terriglobales bacterium]
MKHKIKSALMIVAVAAALTTAGHAQTLSRPVRPPRAAPAVAITTPFIFDGAMGLEYKYNLTATNGVAPLTWAIVSGALPSGITFSSAGQLAGTPTQLGTFNFTVMVTDGAANTSSKTYTWKINPLGVVQAPLTTVDTSQPAISQSQFLVSAGGDLQSAINGVPCGTTIVLQPGAVFTGSFKLPDKGCNGNWIVIRTQTPDGDFPPPGTRVTPADAVKMPLLITNTINAPVFNVSTTTPGVITGNYYRLIGLEMTVDPSVASTTTPFNDALVRLGQSEPSLDQIPHHIIIDRCYLHGTTTTELRRGVLINGANLAVIDSNISEIHQSGADSQAILGYAGPGPFKIENNRLEAAGENVLFGGAKGVIADVVPSDIEIRRNYVFKPSTWRKGGPTYGGIAWSVKNSLEFKNAQRVVIEGNVIENNWQASQVGHSVVLTPRVAGGQGWPATVVANFLIQNNVIMHIGSAFNIASADDVETKPYPLRTFNITIRNNLIIDANGRALTSDGAAGIGAVAQILTGVPNLILDHNTGFGSQRTISAQLVSGTDPALRPNAPLFITNNLFLHSTYGILCSGYGVGNSSLDNCFSPPTPTMHHTLMIGGSSSAYPATNATCGGSNTCYPALPTGVGMVDYTNCNIQTIGVFPFNKCQLVVGTTYKNAGSDNKDLGADIVGLMAATDGVAP